MESNQFRQILERSPPLVDNVVERFFWPNCTDDNLVFPGSQTFVRSIGKFVNGHAHVPSFLLAHIIVQLG